MSSANLRYLCYILVVRISKCSLKSQKGAGEERVKAGGREEET
jgi:hypothetical protein